jgi:transitional endoplasmic reticulum ATPase
MSSVKGNILSKGETINDTYEVQFFIGEGAFGEVYRVKHKYLGVQVMKVFKEEYVNKTDLETVTNEARILSKLTHPNIVRVFETNTFVKEGRKHFYITMGFVSGETLTQLLIRKIQLPIPIALSIQTDLLTGLKFVQEQPSPIVHRDINPDNILLSYERDKPVAMISDFGLAQSVDQLSQLPNAAGRYIYLAPECFFGAYLPTSDVFSAAIVLYKMITGIHPWEYDFESNGDDPEGIKTTIISARKKEIQKPSFYNDSCSSHLDNVILKALAKDIEDRFKTADEFLAALHDKGKEEIIAKPVIEDATVIHSESLPGKPDNRSTVYKARNKEKGLDTVAGMNELKETLYQNIIVPLNDKELYEQYKVSIPNGILLYGPSACGKNFIAQKFAEEIEYNYLELKSAEITNKDSEESKKEIIRVFKQAKEMSPAIIFIDEIDIILPKKSDDHFQQYLPEAKELLNQITDCHQYGIFIIAATNKPEKTDNAIFGQDKMDLAIYVPPPDMQARKKLFQVYLGSRPADDTIDFDKLAELTNYCTATDIEYLVDEASKIAVRKRTKISQSHFEEVIKTNDPSISEKQLKRYESYRAEKPRHNRNADDYESTQSLPKRNSVFISYSHKNKEYLDELKRHFSPYRESLNLWYDTKIKTGEVWEKEIEKALNEAEVVVLLLSPDFFDSEFISEYEIPNIKRRQKEGLKVIIIILSPCATDDFNKYQFLNSIDDPVIDMQQSAREKIWLKAFKTVKEILSDQ